MARVHRIARRVFVVVSLVAALAVMALASPAAHAAPAAPAAPAVALQGVYCQCVDYVGRSYSLTGYPDAYLWVGYLQGKGWRQESVPNVGDIVVWQPGVCKGSTYYFCADPTFGHVNIVNTMVNVGSGKWNVTLNGARQPGTLYYDSWTNCNNVSTIHVYPISGGGGVTFWYNPAWGR